MLNSNHISMGFGLCQCSQCRKPRRHKAHKWREMEYRILYRKMRKKMGATQSEEDYENLDFKTAKYTD